MIWLLILNTCNALLVYKKVIKRNSGKAITFNNKESKRFTVSVGLRLLRTVCVHEILFGFSKKKSRSKKKNKQLYRFFNRIQMFLTLVNCHLYSMSCHIADLIFVNMINVGSDLRAMEVYFHFFLFIEYILLSDDIAIRYGWMVLYYQ